MYVYFNICKHIDIYIYTLTDKHMCIFLPCMRSFLQCTCRLYTIVPASCVVRMQCTRLLFSVNAM